MSDRKHNINEAQFDALEAEGKRIEDESWNDPNLTQNLRDWHAKFEKETPKSEKINGQEQYLFDLGEEGENLK